MDFDPRDYDSRGDERTRHNWERNRGRSDNCNRDDDRGQPIGQSRDQDDQGLALARGPGDGSRSTDGPPRERDHDDQ